MIAGDLLAMSNVFTVGRASSSDALVARYGSATIQACLDEMIERSERQMRSYIEEIPDGVYTLEDYLDNDGVVDENARVRREDHRRRRLDALRLHRHRRRRAAGR